MVSLLVAPVAWTTVSRRFDDVDLTRLHLLVRDPVSGTDLTTVLSGQGRIVLRVGLEQV
jgi:hypothetical protein